MSASIAPYATTGEMCEFCGRGASSDPTNPMLGPHPNGSGKPVYYSHQTCTVWASEVYEEDGVLQKVTAAIERGKSLSCSKCRRKGAAIGCHVRACRRSYHFDCAQASNCQFRPADMHVYCAEHHTDTDETRLSGSTVAGTKARKGGTAAATAVGSAAGAAGSNKRKADDGSGGDFWNLISSSAAEAEAKSSIESIPVTAAVRAQCLTLVTAAMSEPHAWPFLEPVDPVALQLPMYFSIVKKPMDLGTIKAKLTAFQYGTVHQFATDVRQVWLNCLLYNDPNSQVADFAEQMRDWFEAALAESGIIPVQAGGGALASGDGVVERLKLTAAIKNDPICAYCERERLARAPKPASAAATVTAAAPPPAADDDDAADGEGALLCCDGICLRSFHVACAGYTQPPPGLRWFCVDCRTKLHECFICSRFGVGGVDVFQCGATPPSHAACGRFFHAYCVGMNEDDLIAATNGSGSAAKFICPKHTCGTCQTPFDPRKDKDAVECFRCVLSWHGKCVPPVPAAPAAGAAASSSSSAAAAATADPYSVHPMQKLALAKRGLVRCGRHTTPPASYATRAAAREAFIASGKLNATQIAAVRAAERDYKNGTAPPAAAPTAEQPNKRMKAGAATGAATRKAGAPDGRAAPASARSAGAAAAAAGYDSESEFVPTPPAATGARSVLAPDASAGAAGSRSALAVWRALGMDRIPISVPKSLDADSSGRTRMMQYLTAVRPPPTVWTDPRAFVLSSNSAAGAAATTATAPPPTSHATASLIAPQFLALYARYRSEHYPEEKSQPLPLS